MAPEPTTPTPWPRPYWHASGEPARLLYFLFGQFPATLASVPLPPGVAITRHDHAKLRTWDGYPLAGSLGDTLAADDPQTLAAAGRAAEVLRIAGEVADPATLDYLRDTLRAISALMHDGGVAVLEPITASLVTGTAWDQRFANPMATPFRQHLLVLCDEDPSAPGRCRVHTRGLRKFARPDINLTAVPHSQTNAAGALCEQLVDLLALGGQLADGQALPVEGLGTFLIRADGTPRPAPFFNTVVELRWPA